MFQNLTGTHAATCSLYYKHIMIINDDSSLINKWSSKLTDNAIVVIYDRNKFITQSTCDRNWKLN